MQIEATTGYHLLPVRVALTKEIRNNERWRGRGEKGTAVRWRREWEGAATLENSVKVPQEWKMELPHKPAMPLLGTCPKKIQILIRKDTFTFMFIAEHVAKIWKQLKSVNQWMDKDVAYIHRYVCV